MPGEAYTHERLLPRLLILPKYFVLIFILVFIFKRLFRRIFQKIALTLLLIVVLSIIPIHHKKCRYLLNTTIVPTLFPRAISGTHALCITQL